MSFDPKGVDRQSFFALVIYIPDPLGRFLDELRLELVPGCRPHAHVSVLPPRHIEVPAEKACEEIRLAAGEFAPFDIEVTGISVFPGTNVIYLEIGEGAEQLRAMHTRMAAGLLRYDEPFRYHPHVTLAQDRPAGDVQELYAIAARRWKAYGDHPRFRAERAVFVRNESGQDWVDLAELELGAIRVGS